MGKSIYIIGINSVYHELSACLMKNGEVIYAIEEERLNRVRHGKSAKISNADILPIMAIEECLNFAKIEPNEIDYFGYSFDPIKRLEKNSQIDDVSIEGWGSYEGEHLFYSKLKSIPNKLERRYNIDLKNKWYWIPHHICHASSSFYLSPFNESAILSIDGIGEYESVLLAVGIDNEINIINETGGYPNSIGLVWSKASVFLNMLDGEFKEYGAGKVMALAAFGNSNRFIKKLNSVIYFDRKGEFFVDNRVFQLRSQSCTEMEKFFGFKQRISGESFTQLHMDFAAALQSITNQSLLHYCDWLYNKTQQNTLCLAGGVSLNCVTNAQILERSKFDDIFVQPAANDAGTAIGATLYIDRVILKNKRLKQFYTPFLGNFYTNEKVQNYLKNNTNVTFTLYRNISSIAAKLISEGAIIAWFQDRMEIGPRALGNRSILADPRSNKTHKRLSEEIKGREWFRPLAPSVLIDYVDDWFKRPKGGAESDKWMLFAYQIQECKKNEIPAVVHKDGTGRVQVVSEFTNRRFYNLIKEFYKLTGVPILVNTSFNIKQPIVSNPIEAISNFLNPNMGRIDYLIINNFLIERR